MWFSSSFPPTLPFSSSYKRKQRRLKLSAYRQVHVDFSLLTCPAPIIVVAANRRADFSVCRNPSAADISVASDETECEQEDEDALQTMPDSSHYDVSGAIWPPVASHSVSSSVRVVSEGLAGEKEDEEALQTHPDSSHNDVSDSIWFPVASSTPEEEEDVQDALHNNADSSHIDVSDSIWPPDGSHSVSPSVRVASEGPQGEKEDEGALQTNPDSSHNADVPLHKIQEVSYILGLPPHRLPPIRYIDPSVMRVPWPYIDPSEMRVPSNAHVTSSSQSNAQQASSSQSNAPHDPPESSSVRVASDEIECEKEEEDALQDNPDSSHIDVSDALHNDPHSSHHDVSDSNGDEGGSQDSDEEFAQGHKFVRMQELTGFHTSEKRVQSMCDHLHAEGEDAEDIRKYRVMCSLARRRMHRIARTVCKRWARTVFGPHTLLLKRRWRLQRSARAVFTVWARAVIGPYTLHVRRRMLRMTRNIFYKWMVIVFGPGGVRSDFE